MGSIWFSPPALLSNLSEAAGVRAGLVLDANDVVSAFADGHPIRESLSAEAVQRIRAEAYADAVGDVLFAVGATDEPGMPTLGMRLMRHIPDWRSTIGELEILQLEAIANHALRLRGAGDETGGEIVREIHDRLSRKPAGVLETFLAQMDIHLALCPFFTRNADPFDRVSLDTLFRSEGLPAAAGVYFDQRFINYLHQHPDKLASMHWRQFEALTAEWFQREGYTVELGPGRNDGGVDLRLWTADASPTSPPTVIVQCKREQQKVGRVVVKALYADVLWEGAASGLIVTSTDLSPGARHDCVARAYPITTANRNEVQRWIRAMRRPMTGVLEV